MFLFARYRSSQSMKRFPNDRSIWNAKHFGKRRNVRTRDDGDHWRKEEKCFRLFVHPTHFTRFDGPRTYPVSYVAKVAGDFSVQPVCHCLFYTRATFEPSNFAVHPVKFDFQARNLWSWSLLPTLIAFRANFQLCEIRDAWERRRLTRVSFLSGRN